MTVTKEQEIARYVHRVRLALDDLPMAARDELVEDLPEHLAEVLAEGDGPLEERLGPPEAYAAELRAAAGIQSPSAPRPNLDQRFLDGLAAARARLRRLDAKAGPVIGYAKISDFVRLLRPAWWVLRGYLVALVLSMMAGSWSIVPRFGDSALAALPLLVLAVIGSIWLGRRQAGLSRWPRVALAAGTLFVVLAALVQLVNADQRIRSTGYAETSYSNPYDQIQDVYVYDREGRLVEGARLLDQNGQPIQLGYSWCPDSASVDTGRPMVPRTYPLCPQGAPFRLVAPTATPSGVPATPPSPGASGTPGPGGSGTPGPGGSGTASPGVSGTASPSVPATPTG